MRPVAQPEPTIWDRAENAFIVQAGKMSLRRKTSQNWILAQC